MGFPPGEAGGRSPGTAPGTGDARVDQALARLDELAGLPVAGHPAVFEYVHERLADALGDLAVGAGGDAGDEAAGDEGAGDEDAAGAGGAGH